MESASLGKPRSWRRSTKIEQSDSQVKFGLRREKSKPPALQIQMTKEAGLAALGVEAIKFYPGQEQVDLSVEIELANLHEGQRLMSE